MRITPEHGVIEIGNIWFGPELKRTIAATEAIYLLVRNAIRAARIPPSRVECDALNAPSRQAAARFGFTFEGIFRRHMVIRGRNRDTAWFAITDDEWPRSVPALTLGSAARTSTPPAHSDVRSAI